MKGATVLRKLLPLLALCMGMTHAEDAAQALLATDPIQNPKSKIQNGAS